jgi:hypothetical protein
MTENNNKLIYSTKKHQKTNNQPQNSKNKNFTKESQKILALPSKTDNNKVF